MIKQSLLLCLMVLGSQSIFADAVYGGLAPGPNTLGANDDGSAPSTGLSFNANFFGTTFPPPMRTTMGTSRSGLH